MNEAGLYDIPVKIQCPQCGKTCDAVIQWWDNFPFASYVHTCEYCGYIITESEFEVIKK